MKICKKCNKYEIISGSECKVCNYKRRRKNDIIKVLSNNIWNMEELDIVLYNILYQQYDCINKIIDLLNNKTLDDLIYLLSTDLIIKGTTSCKVMIKCEVCNKEYLVNLSIYNKPTHKYCSMKCRNKGFIIFESHKGENNSQYNSKLIKCTNCNKEYLASKYKQEQTNSFGENHHFCCQECYWEYRSIYYRENKNGKYGIRLNKEQCLQLSERATKMISEGKFPQTLTKPHKEINSILNKLNIFYQNEFNLKYQCLDIYLNKNNLGIEIMGDYWHGNPCIYSYNKLNKTQLKDIKQDKRKHTYTKKYYNFEILYLWESDINNNINLCEYLIHYYIQHKGIIEDYNSFNYSIVNGILELNKNIIKPYFLIQNP